MIKNKKILILGGYGFLGNALYKSLKDNCFTYRFGQYSKKKISIFNLKKIKKHFNVIIHCAGGSSVNESIKNPKKDFNKTVGSTKALIKFIKLKKINPTIIYISSPAVFGNSIKKKTIHPISPYGKNKLISEKLLLNFAKEKKLKLYIVRFFSLYGEGLKKQLLWDVLCKAKKNIFLFDGSGLELRSWMHIRDAINIIKLLIFKFSKKKILNAPGKDVFTNKHVISEIYKYLKIKNMPVFNNIKRKGDPKILIYSNQDLKKLKWKQTIPFSIGLKRYIKWFKKL